MTLSDFIRPVEAVGNFQNNLAIISVPECVPPFSPVLYCFGQLHYPRCGSDVKTDATARTHTQGVKTCITHMTRLIRESSVGSHQVQKWLETAGKGHWLGIGGDWKRGWGEGARVWAGACAVRIPRERGRRSTQALLPAFPGLRQKARTAGKAADGQTSKNGVDSALHLQIYAFCVGPYIVVWPDF